MYCEYSKYVLWISCDEIVCCLNYLFLICKMQKLFWLKGGLNPEPFPSSSWPYLTFSKSYAQPTELLMQCLMNVFERHLILTTVCVILSVRGLRFNAIHLGLRVILDLLAQSPRDIWSSFRPYMRSVSKQASCTLMDPCELVPKKWRLNHTGASSSDRKWTNYQLLL